MKKQPLLVLFCFLAFHLPCFGAQVAQPASASMNASSVSQDADQKNLPQTASGLPLLSTIGAGILLGGLVSARRTRSQK
jgi:LPXTG-motif cell wall-anchored protein